MNNNINNKTIQPFAYISSGWHIKSFTYSYFIARLDPVLIIATLHLGTYIDINSINERNIGRQRRINGQERKRYEDGGEKKRGGGWKINAIFSLSQHAKEDERTKRPKCFMVEGKNKGKTWHECHVSAPLVLHLSLSLSGYSRKQKLNNREVI